MNSYRQALYTGIIRIVANILMVVALFWAMYQASRSAGAVELVFCAWFFGMIIPLWIVAFFLSRVVRRKFPSEFQSLVSLPGRGPSLVYWRVADSPFLPLRDPKTLTDSK
ncbi:MAG: hypothetical protein J5861_06555 [Desulfovibrio sp.]|nr:hypothetical protein [Desulfovibrio sp.]